MIHISNEDLTFDGETIEDERQENNVTKQMS